MESPQCEIMEGRMFEVRSSEDQGEGWVDPVERIRSLTQSGTRRRYHKQTSVARSRSDKLMSRDRVEDGTGLNFRDWIYFYGNWRCKGGKEIGGATYQVFSVSYSPEIWWGFCSQDSRLYSLLLPSRIWEPIFHAPCCEPSLSRSLVANMSRIAKSGWAELFRPHNLYSCHGFAGISTFNEPAFARENGQPSSKVFVSHSIRKPKAELVIQPKGPQFTVMDSGGIMLAKEGAMFFSFVPAIGVNKYDMTKKQTMAVSVSELGALLSLGPNDSCEFFHDPYVGKSEAGRVRKIMKVEPFPDQTGYYFMLSVADRMLNVDDLLLVPITKGEFAVMHSAFNFIVPYIMGWHAFVDSTKYDGMTNSPPVNSNMRADYHMEWDG